MVTGRRASCTSPLLRGTVGRAVRRSLPSSGCSFPEWPPLAPARQEDDGLRAESHSRFVVDPAEAAIHVTVDVTVTNEIPNQTSGGVIREFFFPTMHVVTLAEAVNHAAVRDDGAALDVSQEPTDSEAFALAVVDLSPDLYYRDSQSFRLTYDLPSQPPRSPHLTRVNAGYVNVVVIPVGDPGLVDVEVDRSRPVRLIG